MHSVSLYTDYVIVYHTAVWPYGYNLTDHPLEPALTGCLASACMRASTVSALMGFSVMGQERVRGQMAALEREEHLVSLASQRASMYYIWTLAAWDRCKEVRGQTYGSISACMDQESQHNVIVHDTIL